MKRLHFFLSSFTKMSGALLVRPRKKKKTTQPVNDSVPRWVISPSLNNCGAGYLSGCEVISVWSEMQSSTHDRTVYLCLSCLLGVLEPQTWRMWLFFENTVSNDNSTLPYEEISNFSLPSFCRDSSLLPEAVRFISSLCRWQRRQQEIWLLEACDRLHLCCRNDPACL